MQGPTDVAKARIEAKEANHWMGSVICREVWPRTTKNEGWDSSGRAEKGQNMPDGASLESVSLFTLILKGDKPSRRH